jgi:primosomal protein N''
MTKNNRKTSLLRQQADTINDLRQRIRELDRENRLLHNFINVMDELSDQSLSEITGKQGKELENIRNISQGRNDEQASPKT